MTLLVNLFKYRARERRNPTEDFLSETFAEWLRLAAKAGVMPKVLTDLLELPVTDCLPSGDDGRSIQWTTQHVIGPGYKGSRKRPDIVGQSENFFLIIENKIGAGFTEYEDENGAVDSQLELYKDYQQSQGMRYGGIVLLTHYTSPPDAWKPPPVSWISVHDWLSKHILQDKIEASSDNAILIYWTQNLIKFLKENGMTGTKILLSDIIAKPAYDRLCIGMEKIGSIAKKELVITNGGPAWRKYTVCDGKQMGEFGSTNFYGVVMTPGGLLARTANIIIWSGVLVGNAYVISPHISGVPELSVGFSVWAEGARNDQDCKDLQSVVETELNALTRNMKWECKCIPKKDTNTKGVLVVQTRLSLIELHRDAIDDFLDSPAESFFRTARGALFQIPAQIWDEIEGLVE